MDHKIIKMPSLGEDVSQGAVVDIRVKAGGKVKAGDILLEVETDKVVVEVPADTDGEVIDILVSEGDKVSQGIGSSIDAPPSMSVNGDGVVRTKKKRRSVLSSDESDLEVNAV